MARLRRRERVDRGVKVRTEGLYALSSWRELLYLLGPRGAFILGVLILPLVLPGIYYKSLICLIGIFALLALGFDFLLSYTGFVSLGGALFVGAGAYIAAELNKACGLPLALSIPLATLGGGILCTLLLLPALPLRHIYFALVTFVYPMAFQRIILATGILESSEGIHGLDTFPNIWIPVYLMVIVVLVAVFGLRRLVGEDIGLIFRGIKENDQAVKACGINLIPYKARAVFIASALGCFSGAFLAHYYGWAGISQLALDFSIIPIACSVLGGMGPFTGSLLGAAILVPLTEYLRPLGTLRIAVYAFILMVVLVVKPEGLMNYIQRKYHQFERWVEV